MIKIVSVSKHFGAYAAVDRLSLEIDRGEFFVLLGPSGCGKTTLLRMLAGFEKPSSGSVILDGEDFTRRPPNQRPTNMVFQSYALFPHLSVFRNVAYGPSIGNQSKGEIKRRVDEVLEMTGMGGFRERKPSELSGGQQQRVALARALVMRPKVLLLDEPLSALDAKLRESMRNELVKLQRRVGITFVMVTHDREEALSMADAVGVMREGRLEQRGKPRNIYENPVNSFVADFIGKINWLPARRTERRGKTLWVEFEGIGNADVDLKHPSGVMEANPALGVRPEALRILNGAAAADSDGIEFSAKVKEQVFLGASQQIKLAYGPGGDLELLASVPIASGCEIGGEVRLFMPRASIMLTERVPA